MISLDIVRSHHRWNAAIILFAGFLLDFIAAFLKMREHACGGASPLLQIIIRYFTHDEASARNILHGKDDAVYIGLRHARTGSFQRHSSAPYKNDARSMYG